MRELPESSLVRKTFTIKEMDLPPSVKLTKRSLLRWFALSFGLISEKESRNTVLDVLDSVFFFQLKKKIDPSSLDVLNYLKEKHKRKVSEKLVQYHLNRLIALELLKKKNSKYSFNPSPYGERKDFKASFNYYVRNSLDKSLKDLEEVVERLQESYKK